MANAAETFIDPNAPALQRVRALVALMLQLICNPSRADDIARMCDEAERLLARLLFDAVIQLSGRDDLRATHEPVLRLRGGSFAFGIRENPGAMHPHYCIMLNRWREAAMQRYRTALGCRFRCSPKRSRLRFNNQRRRQRAIAAQRSTCCAPPSHTPVRINAPP